MFSVGASRAPDFFIDVLFHVDKMRPREQIVTMVRDVGLTRGGLGSIVTQYGMQS